MENQIELCNLSSFQQGNIYTGSKYLEKNSKKSIVRYLVKPDKESGKLLAYRWTADLCFDKAPDKEETQAPISNEGIEEIREWIWARCQEM